MTIDEVAKKNELDVEVVPPGSVTPTPFTFKKGEKVAKAAETAATTLGYKAKKPGFQNSAGEELPEDKSLEEAGVNDGDLLTLIDVAGGV